MKLVLSFLLSVSSILLIAQNNLNGTWSATTYTKEDISIISQEWLIDNNSVQINILKSDEKRPWGTFSYELTDNQLDLKSKESNLSFNVIENTPASITIKNQDYTIFLKNRALVKKSKIDIPYLKTFKMATEGEYECPQCTFLFFKPKKKYLFFFVKDSLVNTSIVNNCSDPDYQKAMAKVREGKFHSILFDYLNPDLIEGVINGQTPFKFVPEKPALVVSKAQLCKNPIVQKGRTKYFQLTSEDKKTIFIGKEKLKLNEDGTGDYTYLMRKNLKSVQASTKVNWSISENHDYLFVSYYSDQDDNDLFPYDGEYLNIYHIKKVADSEWELKEILHRSTFF